MSEEIVKAQILFKDIVLDEGLQFNCEFGTRLLDTSVFYYVPQMMQMHREIWFEEALIVFYLFDETDDDSYDLASAYFRRKGRRGKFYFEPITSYDDIPTRFERVCNIVDPNVTLPESLMPAYHIIDPKHFKRVLDLLVFS